MRYLPHGQQYQTFKLRCIGQSSTGKRSLSVPTASELILLCWPWTHPVALYLSPLLWTWERLILTMMGWAGVSEEQLKEQGEIATSFGQTLSWTYLCWVREHPVHHWDCPICILYGSGDNMTPRHTVEEYTHQHNAKLTVLEGGEHWFHTPEQHAALQKWEETEV